MSNQSSFWTSYLRLIHRKRHRVEAEAANRSKLNDSLAWTPTACLASSTKSLFCQGLITLPSQRKETLHDLALLKGLPIFCISLADAVHIKTTEFAQSTPGHCKTWPYARLGPMQKSNRTHKCLNFRMNPSKTGWTFLITLYECKRESQHPKKTRAVRESSQNRESLHC